MVENRKQSKSNNGPARSVRNPAPEPDPSGPGAPGAGAPAPIPEKEPETAQVLEGLPAIEVAEVPTSVKPAPGQSKTQLWRNKQRAKAEAANAAVVILGLIDGLAAMVLGPKARMNSIEKDMIGEPLTRIFNRLDLQASETVNKYMDPIMLSIGVLAWLSRAIRETRPPDNKKPPPGPEPENPEPENGKARDFRIEDTIPAPDVFASMRREVKSGL